TRLFWEVGAFSNLRLLGVVIGSALIQIGVHHVPALEKLFGIRPLSVFDCALTVALGLIPVTILELNKLLRRRLARRRGGSA
ncbi:MAG: cation transporting ATPase C-terminal domain-containing protein, partial [Candidatus Methylomirabilis sp.]|nr:cation transporting ATPase C-terminal domain-containing protein [Deltaproteobacteria bacterium]